MTDQLTAATCRNNLADTILFMSEQNELIIHQSEQLKIQNKQIDKLLEDIKELNIALRTLQQSL